MKRIVLTGGPGAGKTTVGMRLAQTFAGRLHLVEEAASQVYAQLQTRWDRLDINGRRDVQRKIYQLQLDQEQRIAELHPTGALLLDRGTVDGAAYWPQGPGAYWRELGTTMQRELERYDLVIWMQTTAALGVYDFGKSNPCRYEDAPTALLSGEKVKKVWAAHSNIRVVDAYPTVEEKIAAVREIVAKFLG